MAEQEAMRAAGVQPEFGNSAPSSSGNNDEPKDKDAAARTEQPRTLEQAAPAPADAWANAAKQRHPGWD